LVETLGEAWRLDLQVLAEPATMRARRAGSGTGGRSSGPQREPRGGQGEDVDSRARSS